MSIELQVNRIEARQEADHSLLLNLQSDIDKCNIMTEQYHKEKNQCINKCEVLMNTMNILKTDSAVSSEKMKQTHEAVSTIKKTVDDLGLIVKEISNKMYIFSGIVMTVSFVLSIAVFLIEKFLK